ncbi:MAG: 4Fe-4S dicluster domain-containing protein [Ruminococcaceae bacterium]|nr:4Fe-4S dicluster domain-containing protein [Oscillospiraceae bacterium]
MVKLIIDGKNVEVEAGTTILNAAKTVGINIPTLCYFEKVNEIGACRVCVCEVKGNDKLVAACNTVVSDGIEVYTNSPRVRTARKVNVELILSAHNCDCVACVRSGNCALQTLANDLNVRTVPYEKKTAKNEWDASLPLLRDASKCISCMRCVEVCDNIQGLSVWEVNGSGAHTKVTVRDGLGISEAGCAFCGQCITHCPTGALTARDDTDRVFDAIDDSETVTVMQIAPAVRAAWADSLGIDGAIATEKRMVAAAKALGVDYVFDTNFAADLTIMEEASELIERITKGNAPMPMFTSCCPGWVRFMRYNYPEFADNLSSAKSPQQMFGAVAKTYFAEKMGIDPAKICSISVMPCSSKKYECDVAELNATNKDVDIVLTTREFARMLKANHVNVASLEETEFDSPLGTGSGAGVIFGATGGVMEAALRTAHYMLTGKNADADSFKVVRGGENFGIRSAEVTVNGTTLKAAVVSGLANTAALMESVKNGKAQYDFIEVMACPGGCAGGGGQPITDGAELAACRGEKLYELDSANALRFSHENPDVQTLYREYLEKPLSHKAHELLHTEQKNWTL